MTGSTDDPDDPAAVAVSIFMAVIVYAVCRPTVISPFEPDTLSRWAGYGVFRLVVLTRWVTGLFGVLRFPGISTRSGEQEGCDIAELESRWFGRQGLADRVLIAFL